MYSLLCGVLLSSVSQFCSLTKKEETTSNLSLNLCVVFFKCLSSGTAPGVNYENLVRWLIQVKLDYFLKSWTYYISRMELCCKVKEKFTFAKVSSIYIVYLCYCKFSWKCDETIFFLLLLDDAQKLIEKNKCISCSINKYLQQPSEKLYLLKIYLKFIVHSIIKEDAFPI